MYVLEFYYQGEVIERRTFAKSPILPLVGERIHFSFGFTNPNYNEYGLWWVVTERQHLFAPPKNPENNPDHILLLYIVPDPKDGIPQNDPRYGSHNRKES